MTPDTSLVSPATGTRFSLRLQFMAALGFMMLLVLLLAFSTLRGLNQLQAVTHQAIAVDTHLSDLANQVSITTLQARRYEKDLFLNVGNQDELLRHKTAWEGADRDLGLAIEQFAQDATSEADTQQAALWRTQKAEYDAGMAQVVADLTNGTITTAEGANATFTPFKDGIRALTETAVETSQAKSARARSTEATLIDVNASLRNQAWIITLVTILIGIAWSLFFPTRLLRPIADLQKATGRLAAGDLDARLDINRRDELGALANSFNQMVTSLRAGKENEVRAREVDIERELRRVEVENRETIEQTVAEYLRFIQQVARGDLVGRVEVRSTGALGELGMGLNGMVESLHGITRQVHTANAAITTAAAEILAATTQQASSANEQSAALAQTSTTIEEIKAIAAQTAAQATQVARDSQSALQVARQGTHAVEETVGGMGQIRQRVDSIAQTILGLAEQTQAIGEIITTVNQLADQSNLLALNAAIEAARAGEQGKSFAVVAQHVRDLADRSKGATSQVRDILGEIQRATTNAVLVTDEGTKGVEAGARLAGEAGQIIHRIAAEVETGAQANVQMAAAAQQQTAGMEQIGQAMSSIQQATYQALASTRQAERAATDLHSLAQSLQETINVYQV